MKDVIRRGVERQVAEGMFERAQERMWHQFRQLKVVYIGGGPTLGKGSGEHRTDGRQLGQVALDAFCIGLSIWPHCSTSLLPCHQALVLAMSQDCDFRNTSPSALSCGIPLCKAIHRAGAVRVRWVLPSLRAFTHESPANP